jgi:hypothetical protein
MKHNSTTDGTIEKEWTEAIERHRAVMADYLQTAARLEEQVWRLPVGAEKWTPAQITDHLIRTYKITLEQIRGRQGIKMQYGFLLRQILRVALLPKIFRTRQLPRGAKAPKEILPEDSGMPRETVLEQLKELSGEFENEILSGRNNKKLRLTHHVFGEIKPLKAIDFVAIHTEHHTRQLPQS